MHRHVERKINKAPGNETGKIGNKGEDLGKTSVHITAYKKLLKI